MVTPSNNNLINAAIIQRRIQIAIGTAIYINFFLPTQFIHTSSRTGRRYTDEILRAHPRRVLELIRMPITTFFDLRDWIIQHGLLASSHCVTVEKQLITFLWMVGRGATNREAGEQFQHSGSTISR